MANENNDESVNSEEQIKELYKTFLDDKYHYLEDLETELRKPNIFSILGIGRMEIRHSNFLGWLLDPNGSHGLGNKFLVRILRDLALEKDNGLDIVKISDLNFKNVDVYREYQIQNGSLDILIIFRDEKDKLVICIENKIDTKDSKEQLKTYSNYIKKTFKDEDNVNKYKKIFVYLTPKGDDPNDINEKSNWRNYSYKDEIIEHLTHVLDTTRDSLAKTYISDYLTTLKIEIMGIQDRAQELANAIYENHKEIIDFVVANRDTNKEYQQFWKGERSWVFKYAQEFIKWIIETDSANEYELGYTQNAITVKQKKKTQNRYYNIYLIYQRGPSDCNLDFTFSTKEEQGNIRKAVKEVVDEMENVDCTDSTYFTIYSVDQLTDDKIKKIHKIRFGIN